MLSLSRDRWDAALFADRVSPASLGPAGLQALRCQGAVVAGGWALCESGAGVTCIVAVLGIGSGSGTNYTLLFLVAGIVAVLGAAAIVPIKKVR